MSAQIISFETAALRVRIKRAVRAVKQVPLFKPATAEKSGLNAIDDRLRTIYKHGSCTGCGSAIGVRQTLAVKRERGNVSVYCKTCAREPEPVPEVLLSVGMSGEWDNCCMCKGEISPDQHCARDLLADLAWCMDCWPLTK